MDISRNDLSWYWFKGNSVSGRLLQDVCLFRSHVLFDRGARKNFGIAGANFGDVQFSDFESYHVVACLGDEILGVIRVTPPRTEMVSSTVLGRDGFSQLLDTLETDRNHVVEINRLMVDARVRKLNLGRTLIYAAISLIHLLWDRSSMTVIGCAGHNLRQVDFCLKHTDFERISSVEDMFVPTFHDHVSFLKYRPAPYTKGVDWISFFAERFRQVSAPQLESFKMGHEEIFVENDGPAAATSA